MKSLNPYLMFNGNCEEAMYFYRDVFGGEIGYMGRFAESQTEVADTDKNKIMHVEFRFPGGLFMMASDDITVSESGTPAAGNNVYLSMTFEDRKQMEEIFGKLQDGGTVSMPLQDTFWGDYFGMLKDRYGIHWMFSCNTAQGQV